jgi:formamidopyrimidine-DNA glycosylase
MPELPEVEITARLLDAALRGARITQASVPGLNTLKTFDPPLSALEGARIERVGRRGKNFIVSTDRGLALVVHLMSAGRLQLYDTPASKRDRTARLLLGLVDGRELRLREFGTKQAAWAKLLPVDAVDGDEALAKLGPEAWPDPPPLSEVLDGARPLHAILRDQRVIAGIGRAWVDEILWRAQLSPFRRASDLSDEELVRLRAEMMATLGGAITHYERELELPIPDKLPMPLQVHAHQGEPCPRCQTRLEAVYFEDYVIAYCPHCQTQGKLLKDRRMSRLLR